MRLGAFADDKDTLDRLAATYTARITSIYAAAQHLAATTSTSSLETANTLGSGSSSANQGQTMGMDPDAPGFGSANGVGMSSEMVAFLRGLDEDERQLLAIGQSAALNMRAYLSGR
ncbi:hypothetical protein CBOM_05793 [Ceraceosorus bombacis]|uniref:Uncharacterized protein n=1 Tax=Ceraceosorus bombacis TaxID=401625 RepID=A0A0P1BRL3_9BASI|nr:hypothetical protein CBOM_05793 [Ceraceosorus bombacis]